jgi:DTW domain-containing protein
VPGRKTGPRLIPACAGPSEVLRSDGVAASPPEICDNCRRPSAACVCDRIVSYPTKRRILILQHSQEQDALLGSAQILTASLPNAKIVVGLSWRNLGHALGEEDVDAGRWAVLFPDSEAPGDQVQGRGDSIIPASRLKGIVVLDGTWSKAKTLWWRNPWLNKLNRMTLKPAKPSIYGRLRAEPKGEYVSTLESVAAALTLCGESPEIEAGLSRVFRTLVQRVRDAGIVAPRARRPSPRPRPAQAPRASRPRTG